MCKRRQPSTIHRKSKERKSARSLKREVQASKTDRSSARVEFENNVIEYITHLRILNSAATVLSNLNKTRSEGTYVSLAHAQDDFVAPRIPGGKSASSKNRR